LIYRSYKRYSKVGFDYGTSINEAENIEEEILTGRGHTISDVYIEKKPGDPDSDENSSHRAVDKEDSEDVKSA
jgi:hypothetical protein